MASNASENTTVRMGKKTAALGLLICIIIGSLAWYFFYFTKTPEYSVKIIKEAIEKHDTGKFNERVDIDNVLAKGIDDVVSIIAAANKIETSDKKFAGFMQVFKPIIVGAYKENITHFVETGKWKEEGTEDKGEGKSSEVNNLKENFSLDRASFKGIAYTKKDGDTANLGLRIFNEETNLEFTIDVVMKKTAAGVWQISEIANLKDYLVQLKAAKAQVLKEYIEATQPIIDKYNKQDEELLERYNNNPEQRKNIIENELIPENNARIAELKQIPVPSAAQEIFALRAKENDLYTRYLRLLADKSPANEQERAALRQEMHTINYKVYLIIKEQKPEIGEFR